MAHHHLHRRHAQPANPIIDTLSDAEEAVERALSTVVSVVYVTASPTFTGAVGGYTTLGVAIDTDNADSATADPTTSTTPEATPKSTAQAKTTSSDAIFVDTSSTKATTKATKSQTTLATSAIPSSIASPTTTVASSLAILVATSSPASSTISASSTSTSDAASSSTADAKSSGGMSTAGTAGLVVGILLLIGAILAMVLFCFKRRREQRGEKLEDEKSLNEKHDMAAFISQQHNRHQSNGTNTTTRTQATAPRLSLRPVTQFLPNLAEKRRSKGNALDVAGEKTIGNDGFQRPQPNQQNNKNNPFGNHAELSPIDATNANGPGLVSAVTPAGEVVLENANGPMVGVAATTPVGLKRGASRREMAPKQLDFTKAGPFMGPPSPAGTEFSMASDVGTPSQTATSVAIAAAGGPANSAVHRVQLDFVPSMGDELELKAGQLIRVLHEFDDGWAMCIRLDRSQQGVCPRTCLSARPVKPRPANPQNSPRGPPPGMRGAGSPGRPMPQNGRPMPPNGQSPRPMTPQGRPMTPQGLQPRPRTPQGPSGPLPGTPNSRRRANSAAQGRPNSQPQRPRSNSAASSQSRRMSPPGPSPMNPAPQVFAAGSPPTNSPIGRKPVPGQAL